MQFINIWMLFALAAVAIPIIIQILTRKNARRIDWGAWLFLDRTMQKRKRKVLLEDVLLLACRCLAVGLFALAFARPFVRPDSPVPWAVTLPVLLLGIVLLGVSFALWRYPRPRRWMMLAGAALLVFALATVVFERWLNLKRFGGGATKDVVLIVDGSASMGIAHDGKSNFERAIGEAKKYVELAPRNTSFAVIIGGPVPQVLNPVPIADRRVVLNTLERIHPANGTMQIAGNLTAAAVTLAAGHNAVKQIVIIGDGQTVGWQLEDKERWRTLRRVFESLKTRPIITWRTLPLPTSIRNLAIASVRPSRDVVGTDREVRLDVTVVNAGTEAVTPKGVTLTADGVSKRASGVRQLEPGESQTFSFPHRFTRPGGAVVTARVEAEDDLPADDVYRYAMPVLGSLKVLIIDGEQGLDYMSRASTYVALALRPQTNAAAAGDPSAAKEFLVETTIEDVTVAGTRPSFSGCAAVVLSGVRRLPEKTLAVLAEFVQAGGGLFFLPSVAADAGLYNAWNLRGARVLPAPLGAWRDNTSDLDTGSLREELRRFRTGSDLAGVAPARVMDFGEGFTSNAVVIARLRDETPQLVSHALGRGRVVQSAVRFDPASGFVSRRAFLPLVHELVYALARPAAVRLDVRPSEGLSLLVASGASGGAASSGQGLVAYYFPQPNFKGRPIVRTDRRIAFSWGGGSPAEGIPGDNFSVCWRGVLIPPESGKYKIYFDVDDRFTVRIGSRDVRNWQDIELEGGTPYAFTARYAEDWGEAKIYFKWKTPSGRNETVPESCFRTRFAGMESPGEIVEVADPHGETFYAEIAPSDEGLVLRTARSVVPGVYTVSDIPEIQKSTLASVLGTDGKLRFSVSSGVEESTLTAITQSQLSDLCNYVQISQAIKDEDVVNAIGGQSFGKEVWRLLAFAAFLFLVAEPAISRWIAINRRTGDIIDTEGSWIKM